MSEKGALAQVRQAVQQGKVLWRRHALERMLERGISRRAALSVILQGEVIEDYSEDRPVPTFLLLDWDGGRPLHVVAALDADGQAAVITAYEPDLETFESDYRTRRKK